MTARAAGRLAWSLGVLALVFFAAGMGLSLAASVSNAFRVFTFAIVIGLSVVGGLIASWQPRNPIGWIFCGPRSLPASRTSGSSAGPGGRPPGARRSGIAAVTGVAILRHRLYDMSRHRRACPRG